MSFPAKYLSTVVPKSPQYTGSITTDSISNTVTTVLDLTVAAQIPSPTGLTITPTGTGGASTWKYKVVAIKGGKRSEASAEVTIANGNANLSTTNYNAAAWDAVEDSDGYELWRTTAATSPNTTGLIGKVGPDTLSFNDTGIAADGNTAPSTNTTEKNSADAPHFVYIENLSANPLLVYFCKAPSATVAGRKGDAILGASPAAGTLTKRDYIPGTGGTRNPTGQYACTDGYQYVCLRGSGGATTALIKVA